LIVLDTHAWLWWVSDPEKLSRAASRRIAAADAIGVAAVSCFEVAAAVAKGRIGLDRDTLEWIEQALALPKVELLSLTPAVAVKATQLGRSFPGDPADRLIVASALLASASLITKDEKIRAYPAVDAVW
jgi:PIN domain nuclease of toxin-antitoxin system